MTVTFEPDPEASPTRGLLQHRLYRLQEEGANMQLLMRFTTLPAKLLPDLSWRSLRTRLLRLAGWQIGFGTALFDVPNIYGRGKILRRFSIGEHCIVNVGSLFELNDSITIGDRVSIGHQVLFLTTTHLVEGECQRAGRLVSAPIVVENGAWVGARSVVLPGVTIGRGSVVGAASVVTRDVPANTLVAGAPARFVKALPT
ncbi:MAG: transferase hexapeptide repeat containing protein [Ilumatobacteraceae bacterium]|nr:transferase hexapeptide repeat containing protein [Ilumatobacteraceae bacterium]